MSGNLNPVYDSLCKKHQTTRRRIFKDNNGKYKEQLEIQNCEKRTLFGSRPFEGKSNWKLDDLSDIEDDDIQVSKGRQHQNGKIKNDGMLTNEIDQNNAKSDAKRSESSTRDFKGSLQTIIDKLKDDRITIAQRDSQGVKKIYEKNRDGVDYEESNISTMS